MLLLFKMLMMRMENVECVSVRFLKRLQSSRQFSRIYIILFFAVVVEVCEGERFGSCDGMTTDLFVLLCHSRFVFADVTGRLIFGLEPKRWLFYRLQSIQQLFFFVRHCDVM